MNEATARDAFFKRIRQHPQLSDAPPESFASPVESSKLGRNTLYLPLRTPALDEKGSTVKYEILDLENHMDSSEMTPKGELAAGGKLGSWEAAMAGQATRSSPVRRVSHCL